MCWVGYIKMSLSVQFEIRTGVVPDTIPRPVKHAASDPRSIMVVLNDTRMSVFNAIKYAIPDIYTEKGLRDVRCAAVEFMNSRGSFGMMLLDKGQTTGEVVQKLKGSSEVMGVVYISLPPLLNVTFYEKPNEYLTTVLVDVPYGTDGKSFIASISKSARLGRRKFESVIISVGRAHPVAFFIDKKTGTDVFESIINYRNQGQGVSGKVIVV